MRCTLCYRTRLESLHSVYYLRVHQFLDNQFIFVKGLVGGSEGIIHLRFETGKILPRITRSTQHSSSYHQMKQNRQNSIQLQEPYLHRSASYDRIHFVFLSLPATLPVPSSLPSCARTYCSVNQRLPSFFFPSRKYHNHVRDYSALAVARLVRVPRDHRYIFILLHTYWYVFTHILLVGI